MAIKSSIEWTESTWNPVTGCTKISAGCRYCYAERMAKRLRAMGSPNYKDGFKVSLHRRASNLPLGWKKPQMIFVNSMSDLFHKDIPLEYILKVFDVMKRCPQHQFQILTKRAGRMLQLDIKLPWQENIWMGVTVENQKCVHRIEQLRQIGAKTKFLSLEPLLGPLQNLNLQDINWVIVGGESGPGARSMKPEWVLDIRDQCLEAQVPFFFKQWGGVNKKKAGRILDNQTWDQMPVSFARLSA
ncbi:MAG: phage Gp37/Gp68 family protein [Candidatus Zixiibacteriota bacterium]